MWIKFSVTILLMWIKFHLLSQHQLFLKQSKCAFGASEVEYLGHLVGKDGVRVDPKNIEAMHYWLHPKALKILREFLGLTGYYRKFVKNYGNIAAPLTTLLKRTLSVGLQLLLKLLKT